MPSAAMDMGKTKKKYVLAVASSNKKIAKRKDKEKIKSKLSSDKKGAAQASSSKGSKPTPDTECFYCHEKGHFKMNYLKYKRDLDEGKVQKKASERYTCY